MPRTIDYIRRMSFADRVKKLPTLGIGVSTEYGARRTPGALDPVELRTKHREFAGFLEVGIETAKGLDADARAWADRRWPTTYHFLDVNLDEREDVADREWLDEVKAVAAELKPAWMCGDASSSNCAGGWYPSATPPA